MKPMTLKDRAATLLERLGISPTADRVREVLLVFHAVKLSVYQEVNDSFDSEIAEAIDSINSDIEALKQG